MTQKITDDRLEFYRHPLRGPSRMLNANGRPIGGDTPLHTTVCSGQVERLISLSTFRLKGGGWSSTGYK